MCKAVTLLMDMGFNLGREETQDVSEGIQDDATVRESVEGRSWWSERTVKVG